MYNLVIAKIKDQWETSVFLFTKNTTVTNGKLFASIAQVYKSVGLPVSRISARFQSGFVETTNYHCTRTGPCAGGICDLCSQCVSTTIEFVTVNVPEEYDTNVLQEPDFIYNGGGGWVPPAPTETTTPCEIINKLASDYKIKQKMTNLETAAKNYKFESVFPMYNDPNVQPVCCPASYQAIPSTGIVGNQYNPTVTWSGTTDVKGLLHSHYEGLLSVPSGTDLQDLYNLMKNPLITDDFFYGLVTHSGTRYMLIISDRAAFVAFGDKYLSQRKLGDFEKDIYNKIYEISENASAVNNEIGFVKMLTQMNTGVTTFSANSDFTSYQKLTYNNNQVTPSNCN